MSCMQITVCWGSSISINAALICRGEKMSIAIMAGVLEARGHNVTVIDPVEKLLAVGHYLESTVDIAESTCRGCGKPHSG